MKVRVRIDELILEGVEPVAPRRLADRLALDLERDLRGRPGPPRPATIDALRISAPRPLDSALSATRPIAGAIRGALGPAAGRGGTR